MLLDWKILIEDLLFSNTKNIIKLSQQTQLKAEKTLEFNLTKQKEFFSFDKPSQSEKCERVLGLTSLEVNNSNFSLTNQKQTFLKYLNILKGRPFLRGYEK